MILSKTSVYAIRALTFLAQQYLSSKKPVNVQSIAAECELPERFTANILQDLSKRGLLKSMKGPRGGFFIDNSNVTLMEVVYSLEGNAMYTQCGLGISKCNSHQPCPLHDQYTVLRDQLITLLNKTTIGELSTGLIEGNTFLSKQKN